jgi:NgoMIV restriction enzyme
LLTHLRPGKWRIGSGKSIAQFAQYAHLLAIDKVLNDNPGLKASLGGDYIIKPDIVIGRMPEDDDVINGAEVIVDDSSVNYAALRKKSGAGEMLLPALVASGPSARIAFRTRVLKRSISFAIGKDICPMS